MTEQQKEFLRLYLIKAIKIKDVANLMKLPKSDLTQWYEELKVERNKIARIKNTWTRKKFTADFEEFYNWITNKERKCDYCDITEAEIDRLLTAEKLDTKRIPTRGRSLEYDRKEPNLEYNQLENIVLCCYWCNNAKTDTFTYDEFKEIGKAIKLVWQARLNSI